MADADILETAGGHAIPPLRMAPALFLDKTTVLYGPSKTGKTVLVKGIMQQLSGHIEQVLLVAPTEPANRSYEGFIDPPLIHHRLYLADPAGKKDTERKAGLRFLEAVWARQEMMAAIYMRANSAKVLNALYGRLPDEAREAGNAHIKALNRKRTRVVDSLKAQYAAAPAERDEKTKAVNAKFTKMIALLCKKFISPHVDTLWAASGLSEEERFSLHYLHFNPRLLLIFDDCAAQLKPYFGQDVFRKLFYQNRHSFISLVLCCQDDTDLPTNLRKNAFTSLFTEPIVCISNFERTSNQFQKATRQYVAEVVDDVFVGHRKLAYIREDDRRQNFYHLTCVEPQVFRFGSDALGDLCDAVRTEGAIMDTDNPFYQKFDLGS